MLKRRIGNLWKWNVVVVLILLENVCVTVNTCSASKLAFFAQDVPQNKYQASQLT
jgi:hypothetical protein